MVGPHGKPPYFWFRAVVARVAVSSFVVAAMAGWTSPPARFKFRVSTMTATITPSPTPTPFDHAWLAAQFCGWPPEAAFHACMVMRAAGMTDREVELAFLDCRRRVQ